MLSKIEDSKGSVMFLVLALVLMLTVVASMSVDRANQDVDLTFTQHHSEEAFYAAEAGLKHAISVLDDSTSWRTGLIDQSIGGATYSVTIVDSISQPALGDTLILTASSTVSGTVAQLESKLVPDLDNPFTFALFGYERLRVRRFDCTDSYNSDSGTYLETQSNSGASIGSNGEVRLRENSLINGDVIVTHLDELDIREPVTVTGEYITDAEPYEPPQISEEEFTWASNNNSAPAGFSGSGYDYHNDKLRIRDNDTLVLSGGVYYFDEIIIDRNGSLQVAPGEQVVIYAERHVEVKDDASINPGGKPSDFLLLGSEKSRLQVENNAEFRGAFLGNKSDNDHGATFRMRHDSKVFGAIIVGREELKDDADSLIVANCFHFDRSLLDFSYGDIANWKTIAWREL